MNLDLNGKMKMSKFEEQLNLFHSKNIFLPTRTLMLLGEVDEDMFSEFMKNLHALDSTSGPINVKLMSEGGSVTDARAIYDAIKSCKNLIRGICYGEVASAATVILQAFDTRVMTPSSKLMLHVGQESAPMEHPKNVEALLSNHRDDQAWMENIYLESLKNKDKKFTRKKLQSMILFDKYLSAKESLELGLIDEIGDPQ